MQRDCTTHRVCRVHREVPIAVLLRSMAIGLSRLLDPNRLVVQPLRPTQIGVQPVDPLTQIGEQPVDPCLRRDRGHILRHACARSPVCGRSESLLAGGGAIAPSLACRAMTACLAILAQPAAQRSTDAGDAVNAGILAVNAASLVFLLWTWLRVCSPRHIATAA